MHDSCSDGLASAILLHDVLPNAEIRFIQYGTAAYRDLSPSPRMLFCDFSPPEDRYQDFMDAGAIVLDHHRSAEAVVKAFGPLGVFGDEVLNPGVCGAVLAYREVWLPLKLASGHPWQHIKDEVEFAERTAMLAGVRDTWQRQSPLWDEANIQAETLRFFPNDSWLSKKDPFADPQWWQQRFEVGKLKLERHFGAVRKAVDKAYRFTSNGVRVAVISGLQLSSDAADLFEDTTDLVVAFDYVGVEDGIWTLVFSTRTRLDFNCAAFCKALGGGGHTKAAGFSVKLDPNGTSKDPISTLRDLLTAYQDTTDQQVVS